VHWGSGKQAERKTTGKEPKMLMLCLFFDAWQDKKKPRKLAGWLR